MFSTKLKVFFGLDWDYSCRVLPCLTLQPAKLISLITTASSVTTSVATSITASVATASLQRALPAKPLGQSSGLVFATVLPNTSSMRSPRHQTPVPAAAPVVLPSQPASGSKSEPSSSEKTSRAGDSVRVQSTAAVSENSDGGGDKSKESGDLHGSTVKEEPAISGRSEKDGSVATSTDAKEGSDSKEPKASSAQFYALTPGILPPDFDDGNDQPSVLVDADYHVLYKEYNLRKSRTFMTTIKQEKKRKKEADTPGGSGAETTKSLPEKRERSEEGSGQDESGAAKRLKTDSEAVEKEAEKKPAEKSESPASKTSPHKRGRKPSLSQSKRSHGKKQACRGGRGANENDTEMLCCLCFKKDSAYKLGFLFGPYKPVATGDKEKLKSPSTATTETSGVLAEGEGNTATSPSSSSPLWVHEDCAVWAPGVCLVRGKLLGLHEAVEDGKGLVGITFFLLFQSPLPLFWL